MDIKSCYIGPEISPEQFIPEHLFLFLAKGILSGYDGSNYVTMNPGDCCIVRKNHLVRYNKQKKIDEFEKVAVVFDEIFLKRFQEKYQPVRRGYKPKEVFIHLNNNEQITRFISSLMPYYDGKGKIKKEKQDSKREELLLILLEMQPELYGVFFDFGKPEKIDLEKFMNQNYKFNVGIERFAYLTGRSLSAFKRDFKQTFNDTPSRWLIQKRLQEAYFLIFKKNQKPSEIYIDLGFENLSHFSFAFKKQFGISPKNLLC
ncbi:AraC family transcriptional regulator [Arenibacter sp. F20364]|uniref:helix-turn-helix domain-containing protein n=1 Tax=Arenibacter sp. F20364 TaxID=2926415 RepID=UPI001FF5A70B|nr:AraC family transcriptional regulator [Arenibacter sp. F20364]MCK0190287.1 AraC family transcriptional regulator [Arenibacter sp. F20364]